HRLAIERFDRFRRHQARRAGAKPLAGLNRPRPSRNKGGPLQISNPRQNMVKPSGPGMDKSLLIVAALALLVGCGSETPTVPASQARPVAFFPRTLDSSCGEGRARLYDE